MLEKNKTNFQKRPSTDLDKKHIYQLPMSQPFEWYNSRLLSIKSPSDEPCVTLKICGGGRESPCTATERLRNKACRGAPPRPRLMIRRCFHYERRGPRFDSRRGRRRSCSGSWSAGEYGDCSTRSIFCGHVIARVDAGGRCSGA